MKPKIEIKFKHWWEDYLDDLATTSLRLLEVGDEFKNVAGYKVEILDKKFDELNNEMVYFGKCENGLISVWSEYEVEEIIYD